MGKNDGMMKFTGFIAGVGGVVHILQPFGVDLLSYLGALGAPVQVLAGAAGAYVGFKIYSCMLT